MYPDKIFGLFHLYGLMIAVGILVCFVVLFWYGKRKKIEEKFMDFVFYLAIAAIAVGFGAAALFQATYNYIDNPSEGFNLDGGITFIGGLIGGIACFVGLYFIFRKKYEGRLVDIITILPCCILIAHAFGRIGCFFAGCCYGKETSSFLGVKFPDLSYKVHPTQLYEAAFLFLLFAICFLLIVKKDFKHNMSVYLIAYGVFRFCIEYLRGDERGRFLGTAISPSQFWSICMVAAGVGVYFLLEWALKRRAQELAAKAETGNEETDDANSENTNEETTEIEQ